MRVECPNCHYQFTIVGARAGKITPVCGSCHRQLLIAIPEDKSLKPFVTLMQAPAVSPADASEMLAVGEPSSRPERKRRHRNLRSLMQRASDRSAPTPGAIPQRPPDELGQVPSDSDHVEGMDPDWQRMVRRVQRRKARRRASEPGEAVVGSVVRSILAILLFMLFGLWVYQDYQESLPPEIPAPTTRNLAATPAPTRVVVVERSETATRIMNFAHRYGSWNAALAGVMLLFSCFFRGTLVGILTIAGALIAVFAHPMWAGISNPVALAVGAGLAASGMYYSRNA